MPKGGAHRRKLDSEHDRAGTYRPDRHGAREERVDFSEGVPECPQALADGAKREWFRIVSILKEAGILRPAYRTAIARYCVLAAEAEDDPAGFRRDVELRQYIGLLGLSPVAACRLTGGSRAKPAGMFDDL